VIVSLAGTTFDKLTAKLTSDQTARREKFAVLVTRNFAEQVAKINGLIKNPSELASAKSRSSARG